LQQSPEMPEPRRVSDTNADGHAEPPPPAQTPTDVQRGGCPARPGRRWYRRPISLVVAAVVLLAAIVGGARYWMYASAHESTDDAFIEADIVSVSARVAGHIARVHVADNQDVSEGQLLVEIDDRQYGAALEQARGQLTAAEAAARRARADAERARELFQRQLIARAALDQAVADERTTSAQVEAARAAVAARELEVQFTRVVSPVAGRVTRKVAEEGLFVQVGQPLMAIVPRDIYVIGNFKETQLGRMRPGQPVEVRVDAHKGRIFHGHVDSIQRGTGSRFSLLPPENATGNFVKVVQRVPVKIVLDDPPDARFPLGPGMSVVPSVKVK
jgi:membrane fusion protein, multidrug efflux system